ncbi:MAG: hypothetical protein GX822_02145 [Alcaligenaceae bacterium]|jgi:hypothetical protein|nr:hypothetical protein [Alcaligenaceae bacterium]
MAIEKKTIGRGYSKKTIAKIPLHRPKEFLDFMNEQKMAAKESQPWRITKNNAGNEVLSFGGWKNTVNEAYHTSKTYLEKKGLPNSYCVYKWPDGTWKAEKPDKVAGRSRLDFHIEKQLGYSRDSFEDMAARMLVLATDIPILIEEGKHEVALNDALSLGFLMALWNVYWHVHKDSGSGGGKGGGKNRKVNPDEVKKAYDKLTKPEHNRASILAERFGVTPQTIRNALKKAEQKAKARG